MVSFVAEEQPMHVDCSLFQAESVEATFANGNESKYLVNEVFQKVLDWVMR